MLFNSPKFIAFFGLCALVFYLLNRQKTLCARNLFLLAASYFFYGNLHIWYPVLLVYITAVNFICGRQIRKQQDAGRSGKVYVTAAILLSMLMLAFYKYAHLFDGSIWLPVGLSFFTFQGLTYTIDIYRRKIDPDRNLIDVALFISFFPTLLSGPIERARNMLPQYKQPVPVLWENFSAGAALFVWGMFKKVVIADRLAEYVNAAYMHPDAQSGSTLAVAAVFYSFQIYCDFSGYADMAIGTGRMLGFRIMQNFNFPFCVNTIKEFWRRWHISLTTWFTEYVYISMGGNRVSQLRWLVNISAVFLLSGIWHGATWSFVLWGAIHAVLYLVEHYVGPKRPNGLYHLYIFGMMTFAWIFFRLENIGVAWDVVIRIATDLFSPVSLGSSSFTTAITVALLLVFIIREWIAFKLQSDKRYIVEYVFLLIGIALLGVSSDQFVYFQF